MDVENKKYSQVGERLKELRGNLSQEEFAKKIGVSFRTYQRYEVGERIPHPHVLSKIAEKFDTTVDWILTGDLNIEKAIILEWAKKSDYFMDLIEELKKITARILKLKFTEFKEGATPEEIAKFFKDFEDEKNFLDLLKKKFEMEIEDAKDIKRFEEISQHSPLYFIFRQIEKIFNKGEKLKIDALQAIIAAFESEKDASKIAHAYDTLIKAFKKENNP
jgi:transcriptional regulator with XRE-family HTH domain